MLTTCPWCHEPNFGNRPYCKYCGHETHKSRLECECRQCLLRKRIDLTNKQAQPKQNSDRATNDSPKVTAARLSS